VTWARAHVTDWHPLADEVQVIVTEIMGRRGPPVDRMRYPSSADPFVVASDGADQNHDPRRGQGGGQVGEHGRIGLSQEASEESRPELFAQVSERDLDAFDQKALTLGWNEGCSRLAIESARRANLAALWCLRAQPLIRLEGHQAGGSDLPAWCGVHWVLSRCLLGSGRCRR
jgi:hypothetical protein